MASAQKEYQLLFQLKASLGGNFNSSFKSAISTTKQLQNTLSTVNSLQGKIDGYKKQSAAIDSNKGKLQELTREHDKLQKEIKETEEPSESLRKKLEKNEKQIQQVTSKIEENESKLGSLGKELQDAGINTDNLEGANNKLAKSYDRIKSSQEEYARINAAHEKTRQEVSKTKLELAGTIGVVAALGTAIYAGPVKSAMEFQESMAKINTIADPNQLPLDQMKKEIMSLSNTTGIAAKSISEDVYNAISAGQETADAVNFVSNSTKLAKAGFAESSQTLDILTTILNSYGLEADKVGMVSDTLIQIQNKGKTTVAELAGTMGKIIPTANSMGVSLDQLGAGYALMTSKGIATSETTTYMNNLLNELGKTGTKASEALKKGTGKTFQELTEGGYPLGDVLVMLEDEAKKTNLSLADMFGSADAGKAALILATDSGNEFNALLEDMEHSLGATDEAFGIMNNTVTSKMEKAKNSISNLSTIMGETFLPIVGDVAEKVAVVVQKISEFAQENPEAIKTVLKVVGGLLALKTAGLVAKLGFLEIKSGVQTVQGVMSLFKGKAAETGVNAIGLSGKLKNAGSGIGGYFKNVGKSVGTAGKSISTSLGGLFSSFNSTSIGGNLIKSITTPFKSIGTFSKGIGGKLSSGILGGLGKLSGGITGTMGKVGSVILKSPLGTIGKIVGNSFSGISSVLSPLGGVISSVFSPLSNILGPFISSIGGIASKFLPFLGIATLVIGVIQLIRNNLDQIREVVGKVFGEKGLAVFDAFVGTIENVVNIVKGIFSEGNLGSVTETIRNIFGDGAADVFEKLVEVGQGIFGVISEVAQVAANIIGDTLSVMIPAIASAASAIWNIIQPIAMGILSLIEFLLPTIKEIMTNIFTVVGGVISNITTALSGVINFISGVFTGNWSQAWDGVVGIFTGIFGGIKDIAKGVMNGVISVLNIGIRALNKIQIPEWVPVVGGKGINIPEIPQFARGTNQTPETFIAGEAGAELVTNARNRKVFNASQTGEIVKNAQRAQKIISGLNLTKGESTIVNNSIIQKVNENMQPSVSTEVVKPPTVATAGATSINVYNQPTIVVDGNKPDDLDKKLKKNNEDLLLMMQAKLDKKEDDETRGRYD